MHRIILREKKYKTKTPTHPFCFNENPRPPCTPKGSVFFFVFFYIKTEHPLFIPRVISISPSFFFLLISVTLFLHGSKAHQIPCTLVAVKHEVIGVKGNKTHLFKILYFWAPWDKSKTHWGTWAFLWHRLVIGCV